MHWYLANGVIIDEDGNVSIDELFRKKSETEVIDSLITAIWDIKSQIMSLKIAEDAIEKALSERMQKMGEKSIITSDKTIRASIRYSSYSVQNVHDFVTDIQSRKDELSKETLIELLHAAKSFDPNAIPSRLWKEVLEAYTEKRPKKPAITVAKLMNRPHIRFQETEK